MPRTLHDGWTVHAVGGDVPPAVAGLRVPATLPGCVHLDLLAAGLVPDPYLDRNEDLVAWVGRADWRYETTLDWHDDGSERFDLVALGLDTVAAVELNHQVLARTANMHRSHRIPLAGVLREGRNDLAITFRSGVAAAAELSDQLGERPYIGAHPFNAIRKTASSYGWDWGPELVSAGVWRPLLLHGWSTARIASVRPLVEVHGSAGVARVHVDLERTGGDDRPLTVRVTVGPHTRSAPVPAGEDRAVVEVVVPEVERWWPRGYGAQPLYAVEVGLAGDGHDLDAWRGRVGFRTVTLDTTPDADGTPFSLAVNDVPVFARGVNWIPDDCFPSRVDRDRYAARLGAAAEANVNLVRVWGGGIYESDDFYDVCDELGLLVWQDFLFACAAYAEEEPLRAEVVAEAREAVTRLSPHPSLALWNGNNENIWGHQEWGWQPALAGRTWGWGYYTEVLPAVVAELDPTRPYSPGCPYSFSPDLPPNDERHGTTHLWDVWNSLDHTAYRDYRPRFVSEFGFQGPPTWATLTRAVSDEPRTVDSPAMRAHQKAEDGQGKLLRGLAAHLPPPRSFDDWHWATSLNQARAVRLGVEHLRSLSPLCRGAVVWQLNDCWPVTSWAAIDGDGRRKPAWYALRDAFADRLLTIQPRAGGLAVVAVNDSDARWSGAVTVRRCRFDGTVLAEQELPIDLEPRTATTLALPLACAEPADAPRELLLAQDGPRRAWWLFAEDVDADLPEPELDAEVTAVAGGYRVAVTARTFVHDLALLADRAAPDAAVDSMLVTLLPGERASFVVSTPARLSADELTAPLVLRSANQLVVAAVVVATR